MGGATIDVKAVHLFNVVDGYEKTTALPVNALFQCNSCARGVGHGPAPI